MAEAASSVPALPLVDQTTDAAAGAWGLARITQTALRVVGQAWRAASGGNGDGEAAAVNHPQNPVVRSVWGHQPPRPLVVALAAVATVGAVGGAALLLAWALRRRRTAASSSAAASRRPALPEAAIADDVESPQEDADMPRPPSPVSFDAAAASATTSQNASTSTVSNSTAQAETQPAAVTAEPSSKSVSPRARSVGLDCCECACARTKHLTTAHADAWIAELCLI
jgi:hypothetical protein